MKAYMKKVCRRMLPDLKVIIPVTLGYFLYHFIAMKLWNASCPLLLILGIPCPGCGLTRGLLCLLRFNFSGAAIINPTIYAWALFFIIYVLTKYFLGKGERIRTIALLTVTFITIVYYAYGMIRFFPGRIPYVYNPNNLTSFLLKKFH